MESPRLLYEDNHLAIVLKPPNMPTQPDASGDADLLAWVREDIQRRHNKPGAAFVGLVHRLDRPVGGIVAFARTSKAAARLSEQLRTHAMRRAYWAVVQGTPPESGTLRDFLVKDPAQNTSRVTAPDAPGAKEAVLRYQALERAQGFTLLAVELETGRSHQIRAQLAHMGWPIWGDARYGEIQRGHPIALWGTALTLVHPTRKEAMRFDAPPPSAFPWTCFHAIKKEV